MSAAAERPSPRPEPPVDLRDRPMPLITLQVSWFRIHGTIHAPLYYGSTGINRFDSPQQDYGVMYVARAPQGAFIETFGNQTGIRVVATPELSLRSMSELISQRGLQLVDLTGPGLAQLGADGRLATGDHRLAQRWAHALWSHPAPVDGIYYPARHDLSQPCAALFDRVQAVIEVAHTQPCMSRGFSHTLASILDIYQFGLI